MTEDIYRSQFRLPYSLYEQLKAAADENRRSLNAEITARLEESFVSKPVGPMTIGYMLEKLSEIGDASGMSVTVTFGEDHKTKGEE